MSRPLRFLGEHNSSSTTDPPNSATVDSDFVVILAALLCALICVLSLVAVARCAWLRRLRVSAGSSATGRPSSAPPASANKGLKKKILRSLPKMAVAAESAAKLSDCAICLSELSAGDEIRVLPQCGHGFHVSCIDTWFGSHSSCPSCRRILGVGSGGKCDRCGGLPATGTSMSAAPHAHDQSDLEARMKGREE
ncbi:hypothetical protein L6164_015178 [Bauhinia variegata]|uniref:Uncharacterized protein n=1 Tax=Bauhinia variegata TaxID=167791 RepID=A0ACB9NKE2_BAUVA|nr:hypothetical protein L6164_015178 [Bauhinia variegata]